MPKEKEKVKRKIQKCKPFPKSHCGHPDYLICKLQYKASCIIRGIVYSWAVMTAIITTFCRSHKAIDNRD